MQRKITLSMILCLSIFTIICAAILIGAGNISGGQVDSPCTLFWLLIEACTAVIVVSVSAFKGVLKGSSKETKVPRQDNNSARRLVGERNFQDGESAAFPLAVRLENGSYGVPLRLSLKPSTKAEPSMAAILAERDEERLIDILRLM